MQMYISNFKMEGHIFVEEHDPENKPTLLRQFIVSRVHNIVERESVERYIQVPNALPLITT